MIASTYTEENLFCLPCGISKSSSKLNSNSSLSLCTTLLFLLVFLVDNTMELFDASRTPEELIFDGVNSFG